MLTMDDINSVANAACEEDPSACVDTAGAEDNEDLQVDEANQANFKLAFYAMAIITTVCLVVVIVKRKAIMIAIGIIKEASDAIKAMPLLIAFPIIPFACFFILFAYFVAGAALIYTSDGISFDDLASTVNSGLNATAGAAGGLAEAAGCDTCADAIAEGAAAAADGVNAAAGAAADAAAAAAAAALAALIDYREIFVTPPSCTSGIATEGHSSFIQEECEASAGTCDQGSHTTKVECEVSNDGKGVFTSTATYVAGSGPGMCADSAGNAYNSLTNTDDFLTLQQCQDACNQNLDCVGLNYGSAALATECMLYFTAAPWCEGIVGPPYPIASQQACWDNAGECDQGGHANKDNCVDSNNGKGKWTGTGKYRFRTGCDPAGSTTQETCEASNGKWTTPTAAVAVPDAIPVPDATANWAPVLVNTGMNEVTKATTATSTACYKKAYKEPKDPNDDPAGAAADAAMAAILDGNCPPAPGHKRP
jgi:hypothetical protein